MKNDKFNGKGKILIVRVVLFCLSIWWMVTIFGFSAATATESSSLSDGITKKIVEFIEPNFSKLPAGQQEEVFNQVSFFVRKTGHFGEYAILGLFIGGFLLTFEKIYQNRKGILFSEGFGVLYAITDEFHQGFVDGRSPQVRDVIIDSVGFLLALLLIIFMIWTHQTMSKKSLHGNSTE